MPEGVVYFLHGLGRIFSALIKSADWGAAFSAFSKALNSDAVNSNRMDVSASSGALASSSVLTLLIFLFDISNYPHLRHSRASGNPCFGGDSYQN
jgi:hypothetical protein